MEDTTHTFQSCPPLHISNLLLWPIPGYSPFHSCIATLEELLPHSTHIHKGVLPQGYLHLVHRWQFLPTGGSEKRRICYCFWHQDVWGAGTPSLNHKPMVQTNGSYHTFQASTRQSLTLHGDSQYTLHILLSHTVIWREYELLATKGRSITNSDEIMANPKGSHLPTAPGSAHHQSTSSRWFHHLQGK